MAETSKKEAPAFEKPSKEDPAVVETAAPETPSDAPVQEDKAPVVKVRLVEDYDGPTPVHVSTPGVLLSEENRVEVTKEGVEVPALLADNFTSVPYIEVAE